MNEPAVTDDVTVEPVVVTVNVVCDVATAFELWTKELSSWWPVAGHSVGGEAEVARLVFEEGAGGRIYEVWRDGSERPWAEVEQWDPPRSFVLAWHPGYAADRATEVEVRFESRGDTTEVRLEHRHWDRLGADGAESRASYASGWATVTAAYVERAPTTSR